MTVGCGGRLSDFEGLRATGELLGRLSRDTNDSLEVRMGDDVTVCVDCRRVGDGERLLEALSRFCGVGRAVNNAIAKFSTTTGSKTQILGVDRGQCVGKLPVAGDMGNNERTIITLPVGGLQPTNLRAFHEPCHMLDPTLPANALIAKAAFNVGDKRRVWIT
jgi:hypothetical protein